MWVWILNHSFPEKTTGSNYHGTTDTNRPAFFCRGGRASNVAKWFVPGVVAKRIFVGNSNLVFFFGGGVWEVAEI